METHTNEGRRSTPERTPTLNSDGVEQFWATHNRHSLAEEVFDISIWQQYAEMMRRLLATQNASYESLETIARQGQATDVQTRVGQEAAQGAQVQSPSAWMPAEQVRPDAPQGSFSRADIDAARSHPQPGFEQMYVPVEQQTLEAEARRDAASKFEEFVLGQEAVNNWDNVN